MLVWGGLDGTGDYSETSVMEHVVYTSSTEEVLRWKKSVWRS